MPWLPARGEEDKRTARGDQIRLRQGKAKPHLGEAERAVRFGHEVSLVPESGKRKDAVVVSDR